MRSSNTHLKIEAPKITPEVRIGDSVAVNGICLTAVEVAEAIFTVTATESTIKATTVKDWQVNRELNLELAMKMGDRLGGHLVQGHVDAVGKVARMRYLAGHTEVYVETSSKVLGLLPEKGSVTVDGVSLTVLSKNNRGFWLMIIPHTIENTAFRIIKPNTLVNIETDLFIRWLAERFPSNVSPEDFDWEGGSGSRFEE